MTERVRFPVNRFRDDDIRQALEIIERALNDHEAKLSSILTPQLDQRSKPLIQAESLSTDVPAFIFGTVAAEGIASKTIRADATVALFNSTVPSAVSTSAGATGSTGKSARIDHVHPLDITAAAFDIFLHSEESDNFETGTLTTDAGTTLDVNGNIDLAGATVVGDGPYLRADASDTGSGVYTLTNANPLDLLGNIVTAIDFGVLNATRNRLDFTCVNQTEGGAQFRFLNFTGEFLDYIVNTAGAFFSTKSGMDLEFSALGVGSSLTFKTAGTMQFDSQVVDIDIDANTSIAIDAATSMTLNTAAGAMTLTAIGGNFSATGANATLSGSTDVTLSAASGDIDATAGTDINLTASAGDIALTAAGVISIPSTSTLDFGTNATMIFTTNPAVTAAWKFDNTNATFAGAITLTVSNFDSGTSSFMKISADSGGAASAPLELECVDDGIWINGAATKAITLNNDAVDCDTIAKTENLTKAFEVDASQDRVMVESRDILRYALLAA